MDKNKYKKRISASICEMVESTAYDYAVNRLSIIL